MVITNIKEFSEKKKKKKNWTLFDREGIRTLNLLIRSQTPYPLGHAVKYEKARANHCEKGTQPGPRVVSDIHHVGFYRAGHSTVPLQWGGSGGPLAICRNGYSASGRENEGWMVQGVHFWEGGVVSRLVCEDFGQWWTSSGESYSGRMTSNDQGPQRTEPLVFLWYWSVTRAETCNVSTGLGSVNH